MSEKTIESEKKKVIFLTKDYKETTVLAGELFKMGIQSIVMDSDALDVAKRRVGLELELVDAVRFYKLSGFDIVVAFIGDEEEESNNLADVVEQGRLLGTPVVYLNFSMAVPTMAWFVVQEFMEIYPCVIEN